MKSRRSGKRKKVHYDEYQDPNEQLAAERLGDDFHTDYGTGSKYQRTTRQAIPSDIQLGLFPLVPPLGSFDSPTPQLDWVLSTSDAPFRMFDGDLELEEMEECELEALGLGKFMRGEKPDTTVTQKKQKTQSTHPIHFWTPHIDTYVSELLRLEGPGCADTDYCSNGDCKVDLAGGGYRCRVCWQEGLLCGDCVIASHRSNPFHGVERWQGAFFEKISLKTLGLRIQLGHSSGTVCEVPIPAFNDDFTVISSDGVHSISLDYCGCAAAQPKLIQLLRTRLFPSTVTDPKTAATFEVLKFFQLLSFNSKTSGYEFYQTLARLSDNTGTNPPPDRYPVFMRIVREWRHVRLLKRMGRGHDPSGVNGTKEGECAVLCPACPHPGINLPEDWKECPESEQWLYSLFLGIDANFRLQRMNVSSTERDPPLNNGYAYMVEGSKFKSYLRTHDGVIPDEKSTCHNHDAIKSANSRGGRGTAASGLGTVECSRHDMKRPLAVGDLQKGERYVNMDYFFLQSIAFTLLTRIVVSYDIACQWWINLLKRCHVYPAYAMSTLSNISLVFLVPKFHLPAHVAKCQTSFSFNYTPGVGRTDGESPERGWSATNGVASSTKVMGEGSRNDTLNDHFGDYNWRKITSIASTFLRKAKEAIQQRLEHVEGFIEFDVALPPESTTEWTKLCQAWEKDPTKLNPYVLKRGTAVTETEVRLRLAAEDAEALAKGKTTALHDDISPSVLIFQGIQLEEAQRRLALDSSKLGPHSTSLQQTKILERSNSLKRRIDAWITVQHLYMPDVAVYRARNDLLETTPIPVSDIKLFLPSETVGLVSCSLQLLKYEWQYRYSQAEEMLNFLRGFLLLRSHMYNSKKTYSRGQRMQTRSLGLIADVQEKIDYTVAGYKKARRALEKMSSSLLENGWRDVLRPLEEEDVVGLTSMDDSGSEGRKRLSWIWKVHGTGEDADACTQAALRIEWCKSRARAHRWQEECILLAEEMRRVVAFFEWSREKWMERARVVDEQVTVDVNSAEWRAISVGKAAYARRQALMFGNMAQCCRDEWRGLSASLTSMEGRDASIMVECH